MIRDVKNHRFAYVILAVVLIGFVVLFLHVWPQRAQQRIVALSMGIFYFIWGVFVHKHNKHINSKVILEYLAAATLGVSLLLLILD